MKRRRRRKHRSRVPFRILVWTGFAIATVRWLLPPDLRPAPLRPPKVDVVARGMQTAANANLRPVYRYSVIAGGAYSPAEAAYAERSDPVVRAHYDVFRSSRLHMIRTEAQRSAYVSYRVGNAVYWTRHKVSLPAGEVLLTDGEHEARARCGNRLAATPQRPVNAVEPAPAELEIAEPVPPEVNLPGIKLAFDLFPALLSPPRPIPSAAKPLPPPPALETAPMWFLTGGNLAGLQPFSLFSPPSLTSGGSIAGGGQVLGAAAPLLPDPWFPYWPEPGPPAYYPSPAPNLPSLPVSAPPSWETPPDGGNIEGTPVSPTTPDTPAVPTGTPEPASFLAVAGGFALILLTVRVSRLR